MFLFKNKCHWESYQKIQKKTELKTPRKTENEIPVWNNFVEKKNTSERLYLETAQQASLSSGEWKEDKLIKGRTF